MLLAAAVLSREEDPRQNLWTGHLRTLEVRFVALQYPGRILKVDSWLPTREQSAPGGHLLKSDEAPVVLLPPPPPPEEKEEEEGW